MDTEAVKTSVLKWISPVWIMGKTYKVKREAIDNVGEFHAMDQVIKIGTDVVTADELADTLLHEVLHAIEWANELEYNEPYVRAFATGLIPILRHNPDLLALLAGDYDKLRKKRKKVGK